MIIVLDASAAVEVALERKHSKTIMPLFEAAEWIVAPDLFPSEIVNTAWKMHAFSAMPHDDCLDLIDDAIALIDDFYDTKQMAREVFALASQTKTAAYDSFYLSLARRLDATLVTMDKKLARTAHGITIPVLPKLQ